MSRRSVAKKRPVAPDPVYQSRLVSLLVSHLLKKGKKSIAYNIFYSAMKNIAETTSQDPLEVLRQAVLNITPKVEVKSRRIGGATLQVPLEVKPDRGTASALFIVEPNYIQQIEINFSTCSPIRLPLVSKHNWSSLLCLSLLFPTIQLFLLLIFFMVVVGSMMRVDGARIVIIFVVEEEEDE